MYIVNCTMHCVYVFRNMRIDFRRYGLNYLILDYPLPAKLVELAPLPMRNMRKIDFK